MSGADAIYAKWNLGCGDHELLGYANLDLKLGHPIYPLETEYRLLSGESVTMPASGLDEIRASHVLEHFSHRVTVEVLMDWVGHLRNGGVLRIAVPDFGKIARAYTDGEALPYAGYLLGSHRDENDYHKALFDEPMLRTLLERVGLEDIRSWLSPISDCASLAISLNLMGRKPKLP